MLCFNVEHLKQEKRFTEYKSTNYKCGCVCFSFSLGRESFIFVNTDYILQVIHYLLSLCDFRLLNCWLSHLLFHDQPVWNYVNVSAVVIPILIMTIDFFRYNLLSSNVKVHHQGHVHRVNYF